MAARSAADAGECRIVAAAVNSLTLRNYFKKDSRDPDFRDYADYRKLLENPDVEAVVCLVEDCWHATVLLDALEASKHVYVMPPLCRYLHEAWGIWETCLRTGQILQVGAHGCSCPKWRLAAEWIKAGRLGPVVMAEGSYMRNNPKGEWNYGIMPWATPEDVNLSVWERPNLPLPEPFDAEHYSRWRKYYRYSSGLLSGLLPHKAHPYLMALEHLGFPRRVAAVGSKPIHTDARTPGAGERDCPEILQVIAEFPSGAMLSLTSSSVNEQGTRELIRGHKANLSLAGVGLELRPEAAFAAEVAPEATAQLPPESAQVHFTNWLESIRGNARPNCGIELALRAQTLLSMAEMSERLNVVCLFDPATRKVTDAAGRELRLP